LGKNDEINDQFSAPNFSTKFIRDLSSVSDQGDFIRMLFFSGEIFFFDFFNNFFLEFKCVFDELFFLFLF